MLGGVLKKVLLVLLVVVAIQNWGKVERLFNPSQVAPERVRASARVVLYATEWCGYCKQIRRFLDQKGIPYQAVDIEKDAKARKAYDRMVMGAPTTAAANAAMPASAADVASTTGTPHFRSRVMPRSIRPSSRCL